MSKEIKNTDLSSLSREELEKRYIELNTKYDSAVAKMNWYLEQYRLAMQKKYGQSSEKGIDGQMTLEDLPLFNEAEAMREPINIEASEAELLGGNTKKKSKRKNIKALPVVVDTYELSSEEQVCPKCGSPLHEMKENVRVEIEVIPAKVQVHKHISKVYACRNCEKDGTSTIITAPGAPAPVIPGSIASSSVIADSIAKKYVDATPFYRQEKNNERAGIPITRNNYCNWSIKVANIYFSHLEKRLREIMYKEGVIHCDETYTEVLIEPDRPATRKSYIWVTTTAEYQKEHPIALYNYKEGRAATYAREVLKGFEGYIMCDGYSAYDSITKTGKHGEPAMNVKPVACLVHVRRKFADALKLLPPKDRENTSANLAIKKIANIMHIDNQISRDNLKEREDKRRELLAPALDEFFAWAKDEQALALPQSHYGKAIEYALNQEYKVKRVLEDGRLELDNSLAERTVKPFVIGRKNFLFSNTPAGADASCILYSIVETAKLNKLIPYEYLKYVLDRMSSAEVINEELIEDLLPWSENIPAYVKNPSET